MEDQEEKSLFEKLADHPNRDEIIRSMGYKDLQCLEYDFFTFKARPKQKILNIKEKFIIICAGRGFGKTETGAQWVKHWSKYYPNIGIAGETAKKVRDVMIEGPSGILHACSKDEMPQYKKSECKIIWPNGSVTLCFSSQEPDTFAGPQYYKFWADEFALWPYAEDCFDHITLGLRMKGKRLSGDINQMLITTTPRPTIFFRNIINKAHVIRGSTYENRRNLSDDYIEDIKKRYEGTRIGRQEMYAHILTDVPGALWSQKTIDMYRKLSVDLSELKSIIVSIDPAISTNENSDETGIIVVGQDSNNEIYVLEDCSGRYSPSEWAKKAKFLFYKYNANYIIAEKNQGGEMVEQTLRSEIIDAPIFLVHASRGKYIRAEPVSAIYEQGIVHHVGNNLNKLEDQMTQFTSDFDRKKSGYSPDRLDALVWGIANYIPSLYKHEEKEYNNITIEPVYHPMVESRIGMF